jgi:hypothetical protein
MATPQTLHAPVLGDEGEACTECGSPLAADQRYCLNCGHRRTEARLPFMDVLADPPAGGGGAPPAGGASAAGATPPGQPGRSVTPLAAVTAVSAVVVALAAGVVIGHQGDGTKSSKPQVVSVAGGGQAATGTSNASTGGQFKSDWPNGKAGYTVQLRALRKTGTPVAAVAAAKSAAQGKGAPSVGALDSDKYASLDGGNYVIYSGVFDKQGDAQSALNKLKKSFPKAKVIHVSTDAASSAAFNGKAKSATLSQSQLQQLNTGDPAANQRRSSKLPPTVALPGAPPPKDNKAPAGSGGGTTIG